MVWRSRPGLVFPAFLCHQTAPHGILQDISSLLGPKNHEVASYMGNALLRTSGDCFGKLQELIHQFCAAAYGGSVAETGNQIFVTLRKGTDWPPAVCDVR